MWQRFTERARRIILIGQEEAGNMNSGHVGTEHLLLGLAREKEGVAAQVLQKMGVTYDKVRTEVQQEVQPGKDANSEEPKLTPKAKRVLELAADEARRMRHNYIGTEHLLLALLREKDGLGAILLRRFGFNLEKTRTQVMEYLGPSEPASAPAEKPSSYRRYDPGFSERSRRVILHSQEEAEQAKAALIGTGHMLLALLRESEGVAAQVMQKLGVTLEAARDELRQEGVVASESSAWEPQLGPDTQEALAVATEKARQMKHNFIETEHLLLGLLHETDSPGVLMLEALGVDLEEVRTLTLSYLGPKAPENPVPNLEKVESSQDEVLPFVQDFVNTAAEAVRNPAPKPVPPPVDIAAVFNNFFTPEAMALIHRATWESNIAKQEKVGLEHLLLAYLSDDIAAILRRKTMPADE